MKITQESKEIVGKLVTQGQPFELLNLFPIKRPSVPFWMNDVYEFMVVNGQGFAQAIIVSKGGFYILPSLEPITKLVRYIEFEEDSEQEVLLDNRLNALASDFPDMVRS